MKLRKNDVVMITNGIQCGYVGIITERVRWNYYRIETQCAVCSIELGHLGHWCYRSKDLEHMGEL